MISNSVLLSVDGGGGGIHGLRTNGGSFMGYGQHGGKGSDGLVIIEW